MFHVELRQFPHVVRAFNWTREELDARVLRPWVQGRPVHWGERSWAPEKAKLAVYEGPALAVEELGMGRGWGNATKRGEEVTARVLGEAREAVESPAALEALKQAILARLAGGAVGMRGLLELAAELTADIDATERVTLAARAVWQLMEEEKVSLSAT